jgi:glycosyltransferase involved in cell wall biosynthesis
MLKYELREKIELSDSPLFTFITPTYSRRQRVLKRCIRSVLKQRTNDWEHLICNESHRRRTRLAVEGFQDPRIQYFTIHTRRSWGHPQRDYLLTQSKGQWMVFLDDDNIVFPTFTEEVTPQLTDDCDLLIIKILHSYYKRRPFPKPSWWERPETVGIYRIDSLNMIVRGSIARKIQWKERGRGGDGRFGKRLVEYIGKDRVKYLDKVLARHL